MPDDFQLGLLPERKLDWRTVATSYGVQIVMVLLLINVGIIWPDHLQFAPNKHHVTELIPVPSMQPQEFKPQPVLHAKLLPPVIVTQPKLVVPRNVHAATRPTEVAPPKVVVNNFSAPEMKVAPSRPVQVVRVGEFGSSARPTLNAPIQKVQTGGFGDPNGLPDTGKQNAHLVAANLGSFDPPQGSGQGNGTGGANGLKGTVASAGFGNGMAIQRQPDRASTVATGAFGAQQVEKMNRATPQPDSGPPTTPVEITYKPNPVYTDEARQLKLEGEVLLQVMFAANGQLHVERVARGLGHGLDEAAITAANQMRFKPALRNGVAMDSTAVVHVRFQLAY